MGTPSPSAFASFDPGFSPTTTKLVFFDHARVGGRPCRWRRGKDGGHRLNLARRDSVRVTPRCGRPYVRSASTPAPRP
jgi:hypothetical protein